MLKEPNRKSACVCVKEHTKSKKEAWFCKCTASIIQSQYLTEPQVRFSELPITETYKLDKSLVRKEAKRSITVAKLLRKHLKAINEPEPASLTSLFKKSSSSSSGQSAPGVGSSSSTQLEEEERLKEEEKKRKEKEEEEKRKKKMSEEEWASTINELTNSLGKASIFECYLSPEFIKAYEYQGFDVVKFRTNLLTLARNKIGVHHYMWLSPGVRKECHGPLGIQKLMTYLITIYNLRGNNLKAIASSLPQEAKDDLEAIVATLGIKSKVTETQGVPRDTLTVTLARIAASFPVTALNIAMSDKYTRKVIDLSDIGNKQSNPIEKCLAHPMCASMFTDEEIKKGWVWITFLAAVRLNKVIGKKDRKQGPDSLWLFHRAVLCSKASTNELKTKFWHDLLEIKKEKIPDTMIESAEAILKGSIPAELFLEIGNYTGCRKE